MKFSANDSSALFSDFSRITALLLENYYRAKYFRKFPPEEISTLTRKYLLTAMWVHRAGVRGTPHIRSWVTNPWRYRSSWVQGKGMASHLTETSIKLFGFRPLNELHKRSNPKHCRCSLPAPIPSLQVFEEFPRKFSPHEVNPTKKLRLIQNWRQRSRAGGRGSSRRCRHFQASCFSFKSLLGKSKKSSIRYCSNFKEKIFFPSAF